MQKETVQKKCITVNVNRMETVIDVSTILYIMMRRKYADIHVSGGKVYETRTTFSELEKVLGEDFIQVRRGCIVAAKAIYNITDKVNLVNGETLEYTYRKKKAVIKNVRDAHQNIIETLPKEGVPSTAEEYREHYKSYDNVPFAFADIEIVFNEEHHATDWIFRYGNPALAKLEKMPLEQLIGNSFGTLFANMDSKWLQCYERTALYGELLEIVDYSPEIDTHLKVICFPTFPGHCGCILFDINDINFARNTDTERALMLYFGRMPKNL